MRILLLIGVVFFLFSGCSESSNKPALHFSVSKNRKTFLMDFESNPDSLIWQLNKDQIQGQDNQFLHFGKEDLFGGNFEFHVPDGFQNSSAVVKVTFKYRNQSNKQGYYVFSAKDSLEQFYWRSSSFEGKQEDWMIFSDSIIIPVSKIENTDLKFYGFNPDKAVFDIDSLTITIQNYTFPSYLTDVKQHYHLFPKVNLNNPLFESVALASFVNNQFVAADFEKENDSTLIGGNDYFDIHVHQLINKQDCLFESSTKFKEPTKVNRLALIYKYKGDVSEVYRNNRMASEFLGNEAWLAKQGFKITQGVENWMCYGSNKVSSFQLLKKEKLLVVNIDWLQDHPLFHFPELDSLINVKKDVSAYRYTKYSPKLEHSFKIFKTSKVKSAPRILPTQHGFQSAFLWTEHADFTDIRLHRVTYFGNEDATGLSKANSGFAYHEIPVTKSVFYTVHDTLKNGDYKSTKINTESASLMKTDGFRFFLDTLHSLGNEICLHTPDFFTTNERTMDRALDYITKRYGSHTWIDHGYNNGHSDNRENVMCDGLNSYSKNLWEKYGIKYFWNGYFEDTLIQKPFTYSESITVPYHGFEDQVPYPLYWETKRQGSGFYSWRTNTVFFPKHGGTWSYFFSDQKLNDFTANYGVEFSHVYPAHTGHMGFWKYDTDSNFIIEPAFDETLRKMASLRDLGILQIPTVTEFMDHQLAIEKVTYIFKDDQIIVKNNGENIKGLTFAIKRKGLPNHFKEQFQHHRVNGEDLIFWMDLNKNQERIIQF